MLVWGWAFGPQFHPADSTAVMDPVVKSMQVLLPPNETEDGGGEKSLAFP
jgi:hypothetical protein